MKRFLDLLFSGIGLILLLPILILVAWKIKRSFGAPVLFRQQRPGLREKPFLMYKFRTMTDERDKDGHLLPDDARLTPFGKFLRSTSLDRKSSRLNSSHTDISRMPSSA